MDHVLIDGRSSSGLRDVRSVMEADISTSGTVANGELAGHRAVIARLRCRLQGKPSGNAPQASYVRDECTKKDVQSKIADTLTSEADPKVLANNALTKSGYFGIVPNCRLVPPDPETGILPEVLHKAVDKLVEPGESALLAAAAQHAPVLPKEKRFKKHTSERTRQLPTPRGHTLYTRRRVKNLSRNTLVKVAFETLRGRRALMLYERRAKKGTQGAPAPDQCRGQAHSGGSAKGALWHVHNVGYWFL